jgi:DMSO/TMAO reductase YedYZ molybdopterin-dependent catalytic subunit
VPRRLSNDLLLALILALVLSGLFGWALPVAVAAPLYDLHRGLGIAVLVVLLVWKQAVIRASLSRRLLRRRPWDRSIVWGVIGAVGLMSAIVLGVGWTLNLISFETFWGYSAINVHVILGIGLLPFVGWHALRRRKANRASAPVVSRRAALRLAGLSVASVVGWQAISRVAVLAMPPGLRRDTGSKHAASLSGNAYPAEIWLFDKVPLLDSETWRLHISGLASTPAALGLLDLDRFSRVSVQAVLDCTGGWWTEQVWRGVPLLAVLQEVGLPTAARELAVESTTGHRIVFAVQDAGQLLLATHVGEEPLSAAHGYPVRLVAPGRRGYQWVKWVERITVT